MSCEQQSQLSPGEQQKREQLKREKPRVYEKIFHFAEKVERGESIAILQFQYDYTCNFRCQHCSVKRFQGKKEGRLLYAQGREGAFPPGRRDGAGPLRHHRRRAAGLSRFR